MANVFEQLLWYIIYLALCVGLVVVIWGTNWIPFTSEVTLYRVVCSGEIKNEPCEEIKLPLDRITITFNVSKDQQRVIVSFDDGNPELLRLDDCIVKDKNNWMCTKDGVLRGSMIRGQYMPYPPLDSVYFPKWRWWVLKLSTALTKATD